MQRIRDCDRCSLHEPFDLIKAIELVRGGFRVRRVDWEVDEYLELNNLNNNLTKIRRVLDPTAISLGRSELTKLFTDYDYDSPITFKDLSVGWVINPPPETF